MLEFLNQNLKSALKNCNMNKLYEIRIRANKPITVLYEGEYVYLSAKGLTNIKSQALSCSEEEIADCIYRAGNYSVYSIEEQIKQGFITSKDGERLGLCGECVFDRGQPLTLRNFSSICIRVPHIVHNCGHALYDICMSDKLKNLLIMSPPGLGKTTILRDLGRIISEKTAKNVLICDERGEISLGELGDSCDIMKFSDKERAFSSGIRAMRPDVIITDELSKEDCFAIKKAINAGITVLASAHFLAFENLIEPFFPLFERYAFLSRERIGEIQSIYNEKGEKLYGS